MRRLALLTLLLAAPLSGQSEQDQRDEVRFVTITGVVVDEISGQPIDGVVVRLNDGDRTAITDTDGRFQLTGVSTGPMSLGFEQLGYTELTVTQLAEPDAPLIRIELEPQPVVLEGLRAVTSRLEARRRSTGRRVRTLDSDDFSTAPVDLFRAVRFRGGVPLTPCSARGNPSTWCTYVRGALVSPVVFIDERPAFGMEELETYRTDEIYAVEIYGWGRQIRVYTRAYASRMAMDPWPLVPVRPFTDWASGNAWRW